MTDEDREYWAAWKASSGHPSRRWRVTRNRGQGLEELRGKSGRVRLFGSIQTAERAAAKTGEMYFRSGVGVIKAEGRA